MRMLPLALLLLAGFGGAAGAQTGTPGVVDIPGGNITFITMPMQGGPRINCPVVADGAFRRDGSGPVAVTMRSTARYRVTLAVSAVWRPANGAPMQADSTAVPVAPGGRVALGTVIPVVNAPLAGSKIEVRVTTCRFG